MKGVHMSDHLKGCATLIATLAIVMVTLIATTTSASSVEASQGSRTVVSHKAVRGKVDAVHVVARGTLYQHTYPKPGEHDQTGAEPTRRRAETNH
jgi:hypothetical protein